MNFPDKNTGVCFHCLLQGIFLTRGVNPGLPALQADSLPSEPLGDPKWCNRHYKIVCSRTGKLPIAFLYSCIWKNLRKWHWPYLLMVSSMPFYLFSRRELLNPRMCVCWPWENTVRGFPGVSVENPPDNEISSMPDPGRSHMPRSSCARGHSSEPLLWSLGAVTPGARVP